MIINSIEITNICNLKCPACPWYTSTFHKGLMSRETFIKAISLPIDTEVNLQQFGEGLLHPELFDFIQLARERNVKPILASNVIKLSEEVMERLIESGLHKLEISLHTKESVEGWIIANKVNQGRIKIVANILETNSKYLESWIAGLDVKFDQLSITRVHNWALDEARDDEYVKQTQAGCFFILRNSCIVRWDGTITSCCFDSDSKNVIGNINDFDTEQFNALSHKPEDYKICANCSPSWINGTETSGYYLYEWRK